MRESTRESRLSMIIRQVCMMWLLLIIGLLPALASEDGKSRQLVLHNAGIIDVASGSVTDGQAILVEDGIIQQIAPLAALSVRDDAVILDLQGHWIIPGLTDMHVHILDQRDTDIYLAHGVTTVQNLWGWNWHLKLREDIAEGHITGPRLITTGPWTNEPFIATEELARRSVALQHAAGYDAIKTHGDVTRQVYAAILDEAKKRQIRVIGHAPRNLSFDDLLKGSQSSIDHVEEIPQVDADLKALLATLGNTSPEDFEITPAIANILASAADKVAASGKTLVPTLYVFKMISPQISDQWNALQGRPEMSAVDPITQVIWGPLNKYRLQWQGRYDAVRPRLEIEFRILQELTRLCHQRGVRILAGSDAGNPVAVPGHSLLMELEELVDAGLSPADALRSATLLPARELGSEAEYGSIAVGKVADLVVLSGNPLQNISNTQRSAGIVLKGEWIPDSELQERLQQTMNQYSEEAAFAEVFVSSVMEGDMAAVMDLLQSDTFDLSKIRRLRLVFNGLDLFAEFQLDQQNTDMALGLLRQLAEMDADSPRFHLRLATIHGYLGKYQQARAAIEEALKREPGNESARKMLEVLNEETGAP